MYSDLAVSMISDRPLSKVRITSRIIIVAVDLLPGFVMRIIDVAAMLVAMILNIR